MGEKKNNKKLAVQVTATALAAVMIAGPAQTIAYAAEIPQSRVSIHTGDEQAQTMQKQLYTVGNTSYENNASTTKGNGHDCQHLGIWIPAGTTFKIRQTNTKLGQNLTLKMRNDDRLTESAYTINKNGDWLEITATADSVPLISSVYSANGEKPEVEYTIEGTGKLPIYEFGGDETAFYKEWDELDAPFAVFLSEYTIWLVPARDKTKNNVGSLDDLLLWYDNMIRQYNAFSGLSKDATDAWNKDSGTRYFIKANRHGWGAAYYSVVETAPNGDSLWGYMDTGNWGPLHEVGHGYDTVNFNSAEIWNNVLSHYYQVAALGAGRWLGLSEDNRARYETQRSTLNYFGTEQYDAKLYFWVNMLDKLGPQKTSAYAYQLYRGNKANGIANLGGHSFYVDAYTRGSGYNVSAWFDMWGFTVENSVKQALIENEAYRNVYPLRNLVTSDATAETIQKALNLTSKYSLVETHELQNYFKTADDISGTLAIHLDETALEAIKGQKIRITDGVNTVKEVEVTGADLSVELPIGYYNVIVPTYKGSDLVVINDRLGYAVVGEGQTAEYQVTAEKLTVSNDFVDWTIRFGSNYSYSGTFCTAVTDIAKGTLRVTTAASSPHIYYYGNTFASIKVYDENGDEVYSKICPGQGTTAEDKTIDIKPGYIIEAYHAEPGRGHSVSSSSMGSVKLVNNDQRTTKYEVTEYGLKMLSPTEKSGEENYYAVLSAYMDTLKNANAKADFQNPEKLPAEKAKVNAAVAKLPQEWQAKFAADYDGYYPFDQGVKELVIADIPAQDYTGSPVTPALDITVGGKKLTEDDYRTEWLLNTDVGTARVKVYGKGDYEDCIGEKTFEIKLPDSLVKEFAVMPEYERVEFSSGAKRPDATVTIGGKTLIRGVDYILAYSNNTSVGTATVTANGMGNYKGITGSATFEITQKIVEMTVSTSPEKVNYDVNGATTGVTVMVGKKTLTEGTDYTVSYENNTAVGTATVKITGIGNYEGSTGSTTFQVTEPLAPDPIGGNVFSNWRYNMEGYAWTKNYCVMNFDMEKGELTVQHSTAKPHVLVSGTYASIAVYDTDGSRSYYKEYIGNQNNYQPTDTVKLGLGYIVELYFLEPDRGSSKITSIANSSVTLTPLRSARYIVTERGLKEITADGSTSTTDMASQYDKVLRAYMDQLKKDNPTQEDFWDAEKFPEQKATVEQGVKLLTAEELTKFKEDYAGYYPFAAPASYTVEYDWGTDFPSDVQLPTNDQTYKTEEEALAAMETSFTSSSTSTAKKGDLTGTWTFSGWTGALDGTVMKFTGTWTFTADVPLVDAETPAAITLMDAECEEGQTAELNGSTTVMDGGTISYQWYSANAADDFNGTSIAGATAAVFAPNTDAAGTYYYYVVATNTKEDATGQKTASVRSNMATVTVTAPAIPVTYTVTYDWGSEFPADATLPRNGNTYQHIQDAKESVDTTYTAQSTSVSQKDGKDGTWTFSGWTATVEGTVVKFTGSWSFTEADLVDAAAPAAISLTSAAYELGDTVAALNGATTVADDGILTYQWYASDAADNFSGTPIDGETGESYTPVISAAGVYYYYVIATNTKADATGSQAASTTSSMAVISVREKGEEATYTVLYDWGSDFPAGETLPTDGNTYRTADEAKAAADTKYTAGFTVKVQKDGKEGTWTFSGWTASAEGATVKFTGNWTFAESKQDTPNHGSSGSSSISYQVEAAQAANGKVTLSTTRASRGSRVTISVKPDDGYRLTSLTVRDGNGNSVAVTKQDETTYTFTMPSGKVSVEPVFEKIGTAISFRDVQRSDYFYDAVQWAVEKGITEGTGAATFSPNASCTRAQMVTFLWRAAGSPAPKSTTNPFRDVSSSDYYYNAVLWAVENGITTGTGADKFSPSATVTRGQTVAFLYRAAGSPATDGDVGFHDVNKNDYYNSAVLWAAQNGITSGTGDGKFSPGADCTRAQIVTLLYRANKGN